MGCWSSLYYGVHLNSSVHWAYSAKCCWLSLIGSHCCFWIIRLGYIMCFTIYVQCFTIKIDFIHSIVIVSITFPEFLHCVAINIVYKLRWVWILRGSQFASLNKILYSLCSVLYVVCFKNRFEHDLIKSM